MEEKTIFVAKDGTRFDKKEDCLQWDEIADRVKLLEEIDLVADLDEWEVPEGIEDQKEWIFAFVYGKRKNLFLGEEVQDPSERLENFRGLNYLTNFIFYGSANPCQP